MRKELRQRLAKEYRHAATRMQEEKHPAKKLFYFSVFYGEAERVLNFEWDREVVLVWLVTHQVHMQINATTQTPILALLPIEGTIIYDKLIELASDLAAHFEKADSKDSRQELSRILERLAELSYAVTGNGSYLYQKGHIKL